MKFIEKNREYLYLFIPVLLIPLIYFIFNIYNFNFSDSEYTKVNIEKVDSNMKIDKNNYTSINDDSMLIFSDLNINAWNVEIVIDDMSDKRTKGEIFFDDGNGFSQNFSQEVIFHKGVNVLKFDSIKSLKNFRIDLTTTKGIVFKISSINFNSTHFNFKTLFFLPFSFISLLFVKNKKKNMMQDLMNFVILYTGYSFTYQYSYDYKLIVIFNLCLFIGFIFINLLYREDNHDELLSEI